MANGLTYPGIQKERPFDCLASRWISGELLEYLTRITQPRVWEEWALSLYLRFALDLPEDSISTIRVLVVWPKFIFQVEWVWVECLRSCGFFPIFRPRAQKERQKKIWCWRSTQENADLFVHETELIKSLHSYMRFQITFFFL